MTKVLKVFDVLNGVLCSNSKYMFCCFTRWQDKHLHEICWPRSEHLDASSGLQRFSSGSLAACAWGLAVLQQLPSPLFHLFWAELATRDVSTFSKPSLMQIHQVCHNIRFLSCCCNSAFREAHDACIMRC